MNKEPNPYKKAIWRRGYIFPLDIPEYIKHNKWMCLKWRPYSNNTNLNKPWKGYK